jgi:hypothetical protein
MKYLLLLSLIFCSCQKDTLQVTETESMKTEWNTEFRLRMATTMPVAFPEDLAYEINHFQFREDGMFDTQGNFYFGSFNKDTFNLEEVMIRYYPSGDTLIMETFSDENLIEWGRLKFTTKYY